jgi:glycosyltransferase involved in cell wall biosynthesis
MMTKLTFFLNDLAGGGAERVMLNLANGFASQGEAVDLVLARKEGSYLSEIDRRVKVIDLKATSLLRSLPSFVNYLQQQRPAAVISALEDTNLIALFAKIIMGGAIPTFVTVHNNLSQEVYHAQQLKRKIVPYLLRWIYPFADGVVCVSEGVARDLVKLGVDRRQIHVIYNPIVTPELIEKQQAPLDHPWFLPDRPPVILGVGRLTPQKDFPTLIRAFALVRQQQPARLILLGEGEERSSLASLIEKLHLQEEVDLPGFVDNPFAYMARARVLVLSSAWEGFGNVLVEAMAAGTPVVSTDCPSGPAEILANGEYGQLVGIADSEAMARAILKILDCPPDQHQLKQRVMEFSVEKILARYRSIIRQSIELR